MPDAIRSSRRVILLGVVISLAFLGLSLARPASKAQEPAKATDKKALREQIVALHAEIDLMEVEQAADRQALSDAIKEEKAMLAEIDSFETKIMNEAFAGVTFHGPLDEKWAEKYVSWGGEIRVELMAVDKLDDEALRKALADVNSFNNDEAKAYILKSFGKEFAEELNALTKIEKKEDFSKVRKRLSDRVGEHIMKKATEDVRQKAAPLRKEFVRRSAELAGKKLDLETLERQYREAR